MSKKQSWFVILKQERLRRGWSQAELAEKIGSNTKTVSHWERGQTQMPNPYLRKQLSYVFNKSLEDLGLVLDQELSETGEIALDDYVNPFTSSIDWGEVPYIKHFLGREQELDTVTHWIKDESCRIVAIQGLGGIGKTTLAAMLARQLRSSFDIIYWRSLQQAPSLEHFLEHYLQFVFHAGRANFPKDMNEQLSLLLTSLHEQRCLLVLDNFESILSANQRAGKYRQGYEDYSRLLRLIGETNHNSCLLLTSREKSREVARLEKTFDAVRTLQIGGMDELNSQELLKDWALYGTNETWQTLVYLYAGNPLALKLVAEPIRELFRGDIASFLEEEETVFGDVTMLLEEQFERLGKSEQEVMYWLAIEREAVSVHKLRIEMLNVAIKGVLLELVESLRQRSLIELHDNGKLSLQPVVLEYVTHRLIEDIVQEVTEEKVLLLNSHLLMQAEAKDYVRMNQEKFILKAVMDRLVSTFGMVELEKKFQRILDMLRHQTEKPGYAAGNIINLLVNAQINLTSLDFSWQTVKQAYLQDVELIDVNFSHTNLATSVFTNTFSTILCLALSSDGKLLATGTTSGEVGIWYAENATPLFTCHGHADGVRSVAFSSDGKLLVSGSEDFTLRVWDTDTGQCLRVLSEHNNSVRSVAFSPSSWTIASGGEDGIVRTWDAATGRILALLEGHRGWVRSVAFSPDGKVIASGGNDTTIRLWDAYTGNAISILHGHEAAVRVVTYNPVKGLLASGSDDQTIRLWNVSSNECIKILQSHKDLVRSITFSFDGNLLASSSDDQTISLWDAESSMLLNILHVRSNRIWSLAFLHSSAVLIGASESAVEDDMLRYWDVYQGQCIRKLRGYRSLIKSVTFSPDGKMLASGSEDADLRLWDVASGQCLKVLREHVNRIRSVAFSPDGKKVASGSEDETIRIWDVQTGLCNKVLRGHTHLVRSVAFSPDGKILVSGSHDQTIRLWDAMTGQCLRVLQGSENIVWRVAFSPDGSLVASGNDDGSIYLWSISTNNFVKILQGHTRRVWDIAFNPNNSILVSASDDATLHTWNIHSGRHLHTFKGHKLWVRSVAFSPNGNLIVSGSHDQTLRIWDIDTGHCLKTLEGHTSCVWSVAFSPDGQTIGSCSDDGTIRLWNVALGTCIKILHNERPYERMNIAHTEGLTKGQKAVLLALGAFEGE